MKQLILISALIILALVIIKDPVQKTGSSFTIVCTTNILADTVKNICPSNISVISLMGPGIDPHVYRARESDVRTLAHANVIIYNGLHLEGKMNDILEKMNQYVPVINASNRLTRGQLLETEVSDMHDPHIWHDVLLWMQIVTTICEELQKIDPSHAQEYRTNCTHYLAQLQQLHEYAQQRIALIPAEQRILVTAHDAFKYFGNRYGVEVVGLQGTSTDAQISIKEITDLADMISNKKIKALFTESCIPVRTIQAVQQSVQSRGWSVAIGPELFADALGNPDESAGTYLGMIKHNVDVIVQALT